MSTDVVIKGYTTGSGRRAGHWPASVARTNNYMQANAQHIASVQANNTTHVAGRQTGKIP